MGLRVLRAWMALLMLAILHAACVNDVASLRPPAECESPADCPGADNACQTRTCEDRACGVVLADQGTACTDGGRFCDGLGVCVACFDNDDCEGGSTCSDNRCVDPNCMDTVLNGDESDVDCGGSCAPCANGSDCDDDLDCASAFCDDGSVPGGTGGSGTGGSGTGGSGTGGSGTGGSGTGGSAGMGGTAGMGAGGAAPIDGVCAPCTDNAQCAPYLCEAGLCLVTECVVDGDCGTSEWCDGGDCVAAGAQGDACPRDEACENEQCVDGYCCNTTCANSCDNCDQPGAEGVCLPTLQGSAGEPDCGDYLCNGAVTTCPLSCNNDFDCDTGAFCGSNLCQPGQTQGATCSGSNQCVSGFCVDGYCCDNACASNCEQCDKTGSLGTCVLSDDGDLGFPSCAPYRCNGTDTDCAPSCSDDNDCSTGNWCNGNVCEAKRPLSASCLGDNECQNDRCRDGFCCNTNCTLSCDACNVTGSEGVCSPALIGTPGSPSCDAYLCNGAITTCPSTCATHADCTAGHYCDGAQCQDLKDLGDSCIIDDECMSTHCADGFCCNSACGLPCNRCDVTNNEGTCLLRGDGDQGDPSCDPYLCDGAAAACPNTCGGNEDCVGTSFCNGMECDGLKPNGATCNDASECQSDNCIDGYCCNSPCGSDCDACDVTGFEGTCRARIQGDPGDASCTPYRCDGIQITCPNSCLVDGNCVSTHYCGSGNTCDLKKDLGATCNGNNECQSDHCVDGYCCNTSCIGECADCNAASQEGTCTLRGQGQQGAPTCSPYVCDGGAAACPEDCVNTSDCATGYVCVNNACAVPNPLVNPSYEDADYTGWTVTATVDWATWGNLADGTTLSDGDNMFDWLDLVDEQQYSVGLPWTFFASDGVQVAVYMVNGPVVGRMYQDVTIPSVANEITWDLMYRDHAGTFDSQHRLRVLLRSATDDSVLATLFETVETVEPHLVPNMTTYVADVSAYAGQTVRVDVTVDIYYFWFDIAFDNWKFQ